MPDEKFIRQPTTLIARYFLKMMNYAAARGRPVNRTSARSAGWKGW